MLSWFSGCLKTNFQQNDDSWHGSDRPVILAWVHDLVSITCVRGISPTASICWATSHPSKLGLPLVDRDSPKMFSFVYAAIAHEAAPNKLPSA